MTDFLVAVVTTAGWALCALTVFVLCQVVASLVWRPRGGTFAAAPVPRTVVLIPAHDEEPVLGTTLPRILAGVDRDTQRVVLIADNCHDRTAEVARGLDVEVWERHDERRRGKPHALTWAIERLREDPPEIIVIVDADSWLTEGSLSRLAAWSAATQRPVQSVYRLTGPGLANFAFRVRTEVRLRGLAAIGAPAQLTGTGMAIPWPLVESVPLPLDSIAEDAVWGWRFARAGSGPVLAHDIVIESDPPNSKSSKEIQRRRWEHGVLASTMREAPASIASAVLSLQPTRIAHVLDLLVPPLALLLISVVLTLIAGLVLGGGAAALPGIVALAALAAAVGLAWLGYGRAHVSLLGLLSAPVYAARKIGLYASFAMRRESSWTRTPRDGESPDPLESSASTPETNDTGADAAAPVPPGPPSERSPEPSSAHLTKPRIPT